MQAAHNVMDRICGQRATVAESWQIAINRCGEASARLVLVLKNILLSPVHRCTSTLALHLEKRGGLSVNACQDVLYQVD